MRHREKKYHLDSFVQIQKTLDKLGASKIAEAVTTHYYGVHDGSNVVKLVEYAEKSEIHILKEVEGIFNLEQTIPVEGIREGLKWLKNKGYTTVNPVKMANVDYEYKDGLVRLYTVDDWLLSVILDYPQGRHEMIAEELGLNLSTVIKIPYNKELEQLGKLRSLELV